MTMRNGLACVLGCTAFAVAGQEVDLDAPLRYSRQDALFLEAEQYHPSVFQNASTFGSEDWGRLAGLLCLPAGRIGGHDLFGMARGTWVDQDIAYRDETLHSGALQRLWIALGGNLYAKGKHTGFALIGVGHNSDGFTLDGQGWNSEWIFMHSVKVHPRLEWGIGFDVLQYFDKVVPYPLVYLDWRLTPSSVLHCEGDFIEWRAFLGRDYSVSTGFRYNLEFFQIGEDRTYEHESVGAELGLQVALSEHAFLRVYLKHLFYGSEELGLPDGTVLTRDPMHGASLRLNAAYGL